MSVVDVEAGELHCHQVSDPKSDVVRGWSLRQGVGLAGWVAQDGESLIVGDAKADERHFKGVDRETGLDLASILSVPLWVKEDVIGVLQVVAFTVDRFSSTDRRLLQLLAVTAAIAIENARLREGTQQVAEV